MAAIMNGIALHGGLHPVRRHLPDLQRLQPQRDPHGGADEAARHPRLHARLDRPRRRRPDAPDDRARGVAAPDPEPRRLAPVRHRRDRWSPGPARSRAGDRPSALLLSRQNLPYAPKPGSTRQPEAMLDDRQGRLRAGRAERGRPARQGAGRDHRDRLRGAARAAAQQQLARRENGHRRARRLDAVDDRLRPPGRGLQARGAAARACRASRSRWA